MKIAIAAQAPGTDAQMATVFGRCPTFLFVDTDTDLVSARPNPALGASGGAGVEAANFVLDQGADVVIAPKVGPRAQAVLDGAGIRFHAHAAGTAREALDAFLAGEPA